MPLISINFIQPSKYGKNIDIATKYKNIENVQSDLTSIGGWKLVLFGYQQIQE